VAGAVAIAAVLAAMWIFLGRPRSTSPALDAPQANGPISRALPAADEFATSTRSSAAIAEIGESVVVPPEVRPSISPNRFSGHFVFEDGSIPPEMSFRFEAYPPAPTAIEGCDFEARGRTDAKGKFAVDGLCHGGYVITPNLSGLPRVQGIYDVPAENMRVVLGGYLIRARVMGVDGVPKPDGDVFLTYVQAPAEGRPERRSRLDRRSDAAGEAWFGLPEHGSCTLSASLGGDRSKEHEIQLWGESRILEVTLVLDDPIPRASLRVELRDCADPSVLVKDFCVDVVAAETEVQLRRLCAEGARDPVFTNLGAGSFRVCAVDRVTGSTVYYRSIVAAEGHAVELVEGRETTIELCVRLGGRISVAIDERPEDTDRQNFVTCALEGSGGEAPSPLWFRVPDQRRGTSNGEVTVSQELWADDGSCTSHEVFDPGTYTLIARGEGYAPHTQTVVVRAGETTAVTVRMGKP
jgi:hypothetical protein